MPAMTIAMITNEMIRGTLMRTAAMVPRLAVTLATPRASPTPRASMDIG